MNFEEIPDWLIAGPVVCKDNIPIFTRHQIHSDLCKYYSDVDDAIYIENIVRNYVMEYKENKEKTIEKLLTMMSLARVKHARYKSSIG